MHSGMQGGSNQFCKKNNGHLHKNIHELHKEMMVYLISCTSFFHDFASRLHSEKKAGKSAHFFVG